MAGVRQERDVLLPGSASGRRSIAVLVMALIAVFAAIALIWKASHRTAHQPPAAIETGEPAAEPPAAGSQPAPAAMPTPTEDRADSVRRQAAIARVVEDGRAGLAACYQRALTRDESLVHGKVTVRVSIAPSGRVDTVNVAGPAAFRAMQPCFETAISGWGFPAAPNSYAAEFPLVLRGSQ